MSLDHLSRHLRAGTQALKLPSNPRMFMTFQVFGTTYLDTLHERLRETHSHSTYHHTKNEY